MKEKKWLSVKDIILVTLLSLINVVIFFSGSFLYLTPVTIMLMPIFYSLVEGIIFFFIATKVKKPGAILLYCFVRSILASFPPYIILYLVAGILSELLLYRAGYGNPKALTLSYVMIQIFAAFGSTIYPYVIVFNKMMEQVTVIDGKAQNIISAAHMLQSWGAPALVVGILVTAFIGAMIGRRATAKHLAAA